MITFQTALSCKEIDTSFRSYDAIHRYTTKNDVSLEIKRGITLANRCYYGLNGQLSNRDLSRTTKLILYKTVILRVQRRRGMDIIKEKSYVRSSVQCELAMISAIDSIVSCMSSSTTWTLCSILISKGCAGSAMSFVWRRIGEVLLWPIK